MVIRLWCDEKQIEKVKKLPSYNRILAVGKGSYYIISGNKNLLNEIDVALK